MIAFMLSHLHLGLSALAAAGHLICGARTLLREEIPLIFELLSRRACPAAVLLLLRLAALGAIAPTGVLMATALSEPGATRRAAMGLSLHSLAVIAGCTAGAAIRDGALATQPPIALHALTGGLALSRLLSPPGRGVVSGAPTDARASVVPSRAVRIRAIAGGAAASGLLGLGAVACVLPSQTAATCLLCAGDTMEVPAAAVRAAGATLLPLGTELFELIGAPAGGAPPASGAGRRALCVSAACAAGGQAVSLCQGSHALRGWARGALIGGCGTCAAVALAELVDDVRASRPEVGQDLPKKPDGVPVWKRVGSIISRRGASE